MLYLLLAAVSSAAMALVLKFFQNTEGNRYGIILGNYLICIVISYLRLPDKALVFAGSPVTVLCGIITGIFFVAGLVTMQTSIRHNGATLTAVFAKLGLVISLAVSILAFGERPKALQILGLILVTCAIVLINGSSTSGSGGAGGKPHTLSLFLALLSGGGGSAMAKVFEQLGPRSEDELYFLYLFAVAAVLTGLLALHETKKTGLPLRIKEMAAGILVGVPNYYASFLILPALVLLPAFIVYPAVSCGSILIVMAVSALLFREKHSPRQRIGILLILAALVLLNL